jgi:hypothetical protein
MNNAAKILIAFIISKLIKLLIIGLSRLVKIYNLGYNTLAKVGKIIETSKLFAVFFCLRLKNVIKICWFSTIVINFASHK